MFLLFYMVCTACQEESPALLFYSNAYEVPMGGTRYLGIESGSGDYTLQMANPNLARAEAESGWECPGGTMIYVYGMLSGSTTLTVTDNQSGEQRTLSIKVIDHYEVLRLSQNSYGSNENYAPLPLETEFLYLFDNAAADAYYFKNGAATRVTATDLTLQGKGNYAFSQEGEAYCLTLNYTENGTPVSRRFRIETDAYNLHRLDKNLHLGWNTPAATYDYEEYPHLLILKEEGTDKELEATLITFEMPEGIVP